MNVGGLTHALIRWRFVVLATWLVVTIGLTVLAGSLGGRAEDDYELPGSESHRASEILAEAGFSSGGGTEAQFVLHRPEGLDTLHVRAVTADLVEELQAIAPEARVTSPFSREGAQQLAEDGDIGYVAVDLPDADADELSRLQERFGELRHRFSTEDLDVEVGGVTVDDSAASGPPSELVGIVAAIVILLFAFGSVLAMSLPILVGIVGAASGVAVVEVASRWVDMPTFAAPVAAMVAIGVGIDYALLIVNRYREGLRGGLEPARAIARAQSTAGRSVLFAGVTVVIASLGLVLMDLKLITGVALGIAGAVLVTMLAATTLLPAVLAMVGARIDKLSVRRRRTVPDDSGPARRWAGQMQRHPLAWALAAGAVLVLLSLPILDMRLGFADAGTKPSTETSRRAYDLLADGFGAGSNGPLVLAVRTEKGQEGFREVAEGISKVEGVARVSPPIIARSHDVALLQVTPTTGPRAEATSDLVHRLRDEVVPTLSRRTGGEVAVGGSTAAAVDFADYNADRLPLFLTVVLGLASVLLMVVFRGIPVAIKAVVVNLLSISASFGATVAVFQWGWGVELLNLGASSPVEAWAPMMLIAIIFGLSMDYEVFLVSRMREEFDRSRDHSTAVADGLARTARVITAAAAIMVCVFGSFVLGSSRELQLFGFGLAFAVLIDATIVRMVLVPAVMELLGERTWWLPGWLARLLPQLRIEASERDPYVE